MSLFAAGIAGHGPCAGSTKGGRGYLQLLTIDFLYRSPNGLFERSAAENQADPSSSEGTNSPTYLLQDFYKGKLFSVLFSFRKRGCRE